MTTVSEGLLCQEAAAIAFSKRRDLRRQVYRNSRRRMNCVRKVVGYDALPDTDIPSLLESSMVHGFYRALITRFSEAQGLTSAWWVEKRRAHARSGRDHAEDLAILNRYFPEFRNYYSTLSDTEVVAAATAEFRDQIAAPGTDYHQQYRETRTMAEYGVNGTGIHAIPVRSGSSPSLFDDSDIMDPESAYRVENALVQEMVEDDRNIFGPTLTHVAILALEEYGPSGIYWLMEWLFFPKRYTELLRTLGQTEEALGKSEFERIKRDISRKLPQIHAHMMTILRDDPEVAHLRERLWGGAAPLRLERRETVREENSSQLRDERTKYLNRQWSRMYERVAGDSEVAHLVSTLVPLVDNTATEQLEQFIHIGSNDFRWRAFKRELLREAVAA